MKTKKLKSANYL